MESASCRIQPLSGQGEDGVRRRDPEKFTVWMRSLVLNGHGCTVYGAGGRVVYRVDNYACRRRREVYVMDSAGRTLITLLRKNFGVLKTWRGYSSSREEINGGGGGGQQQQPWFTVEKAYAVLVGKVGFRAVVRVAASGKVYRIDGAANGSGYRVSDAADGEVVAEMRRKETPSGVALGDDVMSLTVGPAVDRLLVVGLVVIVGLQLA